MWGRELLGGRQNVLQVHMDDRVASYAKIISAPKSTFSREIFLIIWNFAPTKLEILATECHEISGEWINILSAIVGKI